MAHSFQAASVAVASTVTGAISVAMAVTVAACGSTPAPPPAAPVAEAPPPPRPVAGPVSFSQEFGTLDEAATSGAFRTLELPLQECHRKGLRRLRYLGGDVQFFVRVGVDGTTRFAYLQESTLGDRETERCMVDVVVRARWPRPRGGEAEAHFRLGFDPPEATKRPQSWGSDRVAPILRKLDGAARLCKGTAAGVYTITAYIVPKGRVGRVQAVGAAPPSIDGEGKVDCLVKLVESARMPSPGRGAAKVTFPL